MENFLKNNLNFFNLVGLYTLIDRERKRFTTVWTQTLLAPIITSILFLSIFNIVFKSVKKTENNDEFIFYILPGILMMTVIQNSFANTSSSLLISKIQGNIIDTLMPPLRPIEIVFGFMMGGVLRGLFVASVIIITIFPFVGLIPDKPITMLIFITLGSIKLSLLGILAGILSSKFDHMAALNNFIIIPLSFLSGTFYSIEVLPDIFEKISSYNPIFFLIDGVRYGAIGDGYNNIFFNFSFSLFFIFILFLLCWRCFSVGYKLKS